MTTLYDVNHALVRFLDVRGKATPGEVAERWASFQHLQFSYLQEVRKAQDEAAKASWVRKDRQDQSNDLDRKLNDIMSEELARLPQGRDLTEAEMMALSYRIADRASDVMLEAFKDWVPNVYAEGLEQVSRGLGIDFNINPTHAGFIRAAQNSDGVAQSFAGFTDEISQQFNSIIRQGFQEGRPTYRIITQMKQVVRAQDYRLERIARTEAWKIMETARLVAYRELEDDSGQSFLYRFGTIWDEKTCRVCREIIRRSSPDGLPLEDLVKMMEDVSTNPAYGASPKWDPTRDGPMPLPHPNCRHRVWLTMGSFPEGLVDQLRHGTIEHPEAGA